jgi:hypothetical protein
LNETIPRLPTGFGRFVSHILFPFKGLNPIILPSIDGETIILFAKIGLD